MFKNNKPLAIAFICAYVCESYDRSGSTYVSRGGGEIIPTPDRASDCTKHAGMIFRIGYDTALPFLKDEWEWGDAKFKGIDLFKLVPYNSKEMFELLSEADLELREIIFDDELATKFALTCGRRI
jgi:hypothetical protein